MATTTDKNRKVFVISPANHKDFFETVQVRRGFESRAFVKAGLVEYRRFQCADADALGSGLIADQFHRAKPFASVDELKEAGMKVYSMSGAGKLFDFGYAMTVHKSQGSQFKHAVVVVDWKQDYSNEDTRRLAYTAVTRAAERLTVLL